jgi:hypothetical protein
MTKRVVTLLSFALLAASCAAEPEVVSTTAPATTTSTTTTTTMPTTTTAPTTTTTFLEAPVGYEFIEIEGEGLQLALPESWVTVDLTQEGWEELLTEGLAALPESAALINEEAQGIISEGGLLLAYDLGHQDEDFVTNLNILSSVRAPGDTPAAVVPVLGETLEQFGAVAPAVDLVEVPLGPAVKASYGFAPETGFTHFAVQYYVFDVDTVFIVTFSTEDLIELEFVFETIMSTFDSASGSR